jgi:cytosine/adenosine deaminase-related metal-dependent hydrolase
MNGHSWTAYPYGDDLKILADTGTSVSYCPLKYLIMGIVMESFDRYIGAGVNLSLGTDTYPKDMLSEMRYAAVASKVAEKRFTAGHPRDVFNAATLGGARLLGRDDLGRLARGAKADIIAVNLKDIALGAVRDPIRTLVESGTSRDVQMVVVDGDVLVEKGRYLRTDERALLDNLQSRAEQIWRTVPSWHWTGKDVDDLIPPSFKIR